MLCLSCVELLPLSLGAETFHFERSCVCLFTWLLDLLNELLFLLLLLIFSYDEIVLGVVNALIKGEIEDQWWSPVTPGFKDKTECITICMPGSSFIHIETS